MKEKTRSDFAHKEPLSVEDLYTYAGTDPEQYEQAPDLPDGFYDSTEFTTYMEAYNNRQMNSFLEASQGSKTEVDLGWAELPEVDHGAEGKAHDKAQDASKLEHADVAAYLLVGNPKRGEYKGLEMAAYFGALHSVYKNIPESGWKEAFAGVNEKFSETLSPQEMELMKLKVSVDREEL